MRGFWNRLGALSLVAGAAAAAEEVESVGGSERHRPFLASPDTAGPDDFGYALADSREASCTFAFFDISGTGLELVAGDDVAASMSLPFPFDFYGTRYDTIAVATNGYLVPGDEGAETGKDFSPDCPLPAAPSSGVSPRIYPLHDDLVAGGIYVQSFLRCPVKSPSRPDTDLACWIAQWSDTTLFGSAAPFDFQTILYDETWEIVFQYGPGNSQQGGTSTTGIMNATMTDALMHSCNAPGSIPAHLAVCISHPCPEEGFLSVCTNRAGMTTSDRLDLRVSVRNEGHLPFSLAAPHLSIPDRVDLYLGVVLPDLDSIITFDPGLNPKPGTMSDLSSAVSVAPDLDLSAPFTFRDTVFSHVWNGTEPPGTYLFFLAAVQPGSLADGRADPGDVVSLSTRRVTFTP